MKYMELKITGMVRILGMVALIILALGVTNCSDDEEPCIEATAANAGPDQTSCGSSVVLAANQPSTNETGVWEMVSGANGQFDDASKFDASFSGDAGATYTLKWTLSTDCDSKSDEVVISLGGDLMSLAGDDQNVCGTSTTLSGNNVTGATGEWTIVTGTGGVLDDASSFSSGFSGEANVSYTLAWKVTAGGCSVEDQVVITFSVPTTNAGEDQNILGTSTTLSASTVSPGSWSVVSGDGAEFGDANSATSSFKGNAATTYVLRWTTTEGGCSASADVQISFKRLAYLRNDADGSAYNHFIYDNSGRLIQIDPYGGGPGSNGVKVDYEYDANGRLQNRITTKTIIGSIETYKYFYDEAGKLDYVEWWYEDQSGLTLLATYHYNFDPNGVLMSVDRESPSGAINNRPVVYDETTGMITSCSLFDTNYSSITWLGTAQGHDPDPERSADPGNPMQHVPNLYATVDFGGFIIEIEYEFNGGLVAKRTDTYYYNGVFQGTWVGLYEYE